LGAGAKREFGEGASALEARDAEAAPATVSGEPMSISATGIADAVLGRPDLSDDP
jgi:hypothetical protein